MAKKTIFCGYVPTVEAMTLREGLIVTKDTEIQIDSIEGDALSIIQMHKNEATDFFWTSISFHGL